MFLAMDELAAFAPRLARPSRTGVAALLAFSLRSKLKLERRISLDKDPDLSRNQDAAAVRILLDQDCALGIEGPDAVEIQDRGHGLFQEIEPDMVDMTRRGLRPEGDRPPRQGPDAPDLEPSIGPHDAFGIDLAQAFIHRMHMKAGRQPADRRI